MKTIDEDIKNGTYRKSYLLYGNEGYLKKQYKDKLLLALADKSDSMNVSVFQGKSVSIPALIDLAETLPFFADRRVILVEDSGFFKSANEELADYLTKLPETTCFLFVEDEVDKRTKLFKTMRNEGAVIEFAQQNEALLTKWILGRIRKEGKNISQPVLELFLSRTGLDMSNIDRELEKLFCYTLKKDVIERDDIEQITTIQVQNKIFDMVDALTVQNQRLALELYYDLLSLKEPPMRILFLITRQFRLLSTVKEMTRVGRSNADIAKAAGVPEFAVRKLQSQARNYGTEDLKQILEESVDMEEAVKTGKLDEKLSVELLLVRYGKKVSSTHQLPCPQS